MNRQNNFKIILTTVIVLVIAAITAFTVINWADIVKKFQSSATKNDGFEKHERNTVQPASNDSVASTIDHSKDSAPVQDEAKILNHPTESNTKSFSKFDEPLSVPVKDASPIGIDEPTTLKKDSPSSFKPKQNDEYPQIAKGGFDSSKNSSQGKSVKLSKRKKSIHHGKHHRRNKHARMRITRGNGLEKRVTFLEKKFRVKKTNRKKQDSLANRVYRLEKLITKKKK